MSHVGGCRLGAMEENPQPLSQPLQTSSLGTVNHCKTPLKALPWDKLLQSPQRAWAWWPQDKGWPQAHGRGGSEPGAQHTWPWGGGTGD